MKCKHCKKGTVMPRYRKDKRPTHKCNHCRRKYPDE